MIEIVIEIEGGMDGCVHSPLLELRIFCFVDQRIISIRLLEVFRFHGFLFQSC